MPMRIVLDLSEKDVRYFRKCLRTVKSGKLASNEKVVLEAARELRDEVATIESPEFVRDRLAGLGRLVDMLEDERWRLPAPDRKRLLNAMAYFVDPDDMIPDRTPGIGYLDDAIMVSLVLEEFRHELEAYEQFREFQGSPAEVDKKRTALHTRMRSKRRSEIERRRLVKHGSRGPLGLW